MTTAQAVNEKVREIAVKCLVDEGLLSAAPTGDLETVKLLGSNAICDSVNLVAYLVAVEERCNAAFGAAIALMDERAMSQSRSPFRNVASLVEFAASLVAETPGQGK